jgi:hypothetical protein
MREKRREKREVRKETTSTNKLQTSNLKPVTPNQ